MIALYVFLFIAGAHAGREKWGMCMLFILLSVIANHMIKST